MNDDNKVTFYEFDHDNDANVSSVSEPEPVSLLEPTTDSLTANIQTPVSNTESVAYNENIAPSNQKNILYIVLLVVSAICIFLCACLFYLSGKPVVINSLKYKTTGVANYSIYYGNEEVNYNTFVRNYLSMVNINFDYQSKFNKDTSGKMLYQVDVYWYAYNTGNVNEKIYISNVENILPACEKTFSDQKGIKTSADIKLDYQKYVQNYVAYRNSSKVSSQAMLVAEFKVNNNLSLPKLKNIIIDDSIKVEIPLSENTFKISTTTTADGKYKTKTEIDKYSNSSKNKVIFGILSLFIGVVSLIASIIIYMKELKEENSYTKTLKKILKTYDNIIVDTKELPDTSSKNVIIVNDFDELLDAQLQVGMPINYKQNDNTAVFQLTYGDMVWIYTLEDNR